MHIEFKKVIIHNFLSYGHAEIELRDKLYCLVRGINNCKSDNALSNGSGKSSWSSAICWCLTGQTTQGLKSNIKNINIDEKECYVTLLFKVNQDEFEITRYKEPKSDLTILVNGENKSGETFRKSEEILAEYLPDLTVDLLCSIIILGQGLPCKFSSNTPSGRKEVLEKLSKSDFMIQDIKNRLAEVIAKNNDDLRKTEDKLLTLTTQQSMYATQKTSLQETLTELEKPHNFDEQIASLQKNIDDLTNSINSHNLKLTEANNKSKELNDDLTKLLDDKNTQLNNENAEFNEFNTQYLTKKNTLENELREKKNTLETELKNYDSTLRVTYTSEKTKLETRITFLKEDITKKKSITDICPTCGQKLIGVIKPDTTKEEKELSELETNLSEKTTSFNDNINKETKRINEEFKRISDEYREKLEALDKVYNANRVIHTDTLNKITASCDEDISKKKYEIKQNKEKIDLYTQDKQLKESRKVDLQTDLNKVKLEKENYNTKLEEVKASLLSIDNNEKKLSAEILYNNNDKETISARIDVDNKINNLVKRDFRGFLLQNVINFINSKAKEYALDVFETDNLDFVLNGNNIDITYLDKAYENLSGGEKQKVDLIIQFAIRDMMSQYLNFSSNILVLDEIFDQLDEIGCTKVLNLISQKLNDLESIFIISHRADELAIPYDTEMVVIKDSLGISKVR